MVKILSARHVRSFKITQRDPIFLGDMCCDRLWQVHVFQVENENMDSITKSSRMFWKRYADSLTVKQSCKLFGQNTFSGTCKKF